MYSGTHGPTSDGPFYLSASVRATNFSSLVVPRACAARSGAVTRGHDPRGRAFVPEREGRRQYSSGDSGSRARDARRVCQGHDRRFCGASASIRAAWQRVGARGYPGCRRPSAWGHDGEERRLARRRHHGSGGVRKRASGVGEGLTRWVDPKVVARSGIHRDCPFLQHRATEHGFGQVERHGAEGQWWRGRRLGAGAPGDHGTRSRRFCGAGTGSRGRDV